MKYSDDSFAPMTTDEAAAAATAAEAGSAALAARSLAAGGQRDPDGAGPRVVEVMGLENVLACLDVARLNDLAISFGVWGAATPKAARADQLNKFDLIRRMTTARGMSASAVWSAMNSADRALVLQTGTR
jgi:hypothetical protein